MKQQIREDLGIDWIAALDNCTVGEAITFLLTLPLKAQLEVNGYDSEGGIVTTRLETDAEEAAREDREKEIARQAIITLKGDIQNIKDVICKLQQEDIVPTDNIKALEGCIVGLENKLGKVI